MPDELFACRSLAVGYDGVKLCGGLNFTLHAGEYMCVIGPASSGKSALVSTVMGILRPVEGEIEYLGDFSVRDIGCMPQQFELMGSSVVRDIVVSGCLRQTKKIFVGRAEKEKAMHNLERLGVADLAKRRIGELSGGQKQRVLLARALCAANKLLILDDPMRGLDAIAKDAMFDEIARINREDGVAVMIVDSEALDGTVLHMSDTQLYCGSVENYISSYPGQFYFMGRII